MTLILNPITIVIPCVMFGFSLIFWLTLANMSVCRVHLWMMKVWFLSLATRSAQLKRSLRSYRLLLRPRSRSMLPERSTDLVCHDNWLSDRIYTLIYSGWLQRACQVQVQSHETDFQFIIQLLQWETLTLSKRKFSHHTPPFKTDLVHHNNMTKSPSICATYLKS